MPIETRGIDHLVILTHDMDLAVEAYRKMGFTITHRMFHPYGTANNLMMFESNFIEIMGIFRASDPDGIRSRIDMLLSQREGISHFALLSTDAAADRQEFADKGLEPSDVLGFEREVQLPDGSEINAVVSVCAPSQPKTPQVQMFVCQQHVHEAIWVPEWKVHPNGVTDVVSVTILSEDPHGDFSDTFAALFGAKNVTFEGGALVVQTPNGMLRVLPPSLVTSAYAGASFELESVLPYVAAIALKVRSLATVADLLTANRVGFQRLAAGGILVAPDDAARVAVEFVEQG